MLVVTRATRHFTLSPDSFVVAEREIIGIPRVYE